MTEKQLTLSIIAIIILALIGGGVVWYFSKYQGASIKGQGDENQPYEQMEQTVIYTQKIDASSWLYFDSRETGMKFNVSFQYPNSWIYKGSIDGGTISSVPFFDKNQYIEDCTKDNNGEGKCTVKGRVAYLSVKKGAEENGGIEKQINKTDVIVDGYKGIIAIYNSQIGINNMEYIGNEKIELLLPDVNGNTVQLLMVLQVNGDKDVFNKILETIRFY